VRRIGIFMGGPSDDPLTQSDAAALLQGLQELGWIVGRNIQIDWRWYAGNAAQAHKDAANLVALAPDVIVAIAGPPLGALVQTGTAVPNVFTRVVDPVGAGYVASWARPGCNVARLLRIAVPPTLLAVAADVIE
jgi:putative tryptophan/tyrosine transport system substrate-binding protein